MKSIKLLLVALGAVLVLGACSNNESKDIEELDVSQESEKDDTNDKESTEENDNQNSSSGAGGSDSGGSGSPEDSADGSEEDKQDSSSSESNDGTKSGGGSSSDNTTQSKDETETNTSDQNQDDSQSTDSTNSTDQSSNNTASSEESYKLNELNGTAVEVIKGIHAVSIPKEQLKNVSKDAKLTFKAGGKTYELTYEKDVNAFANLYIDDNNLETLKKGIVITG